MDPALEASLARGAGQLGLDLGRSERTRLLAYLELLTRWNRAYNLSAVREPREMVSRHLLDSLAVAPALADYPISRLIDVGTGAGLPGLPLAVVFPDWQVTLLDSNGKKTRFLFQCVNELGLSNVQVVHSRVADYRPSEPFDGVISRAFASLQDMTEGCAHLPGPKGVFLAMKGAYPKAELAALDGRCQLLEHRRLQVPDSEGERCLLVLKPTGSCSGRPSDTQ